MCFVSKGQHGTLMMCLLCVSAAICLKLPHYVEDQIKCTPGSPGAPFRYCFMPNHGRPAASCRTWAVLPAVRWLNVWLLLRDALLIRRRARKVWVRWQDSLVHNEPEDCASTTRSNFIMRSEAWNTGSCITIMYNKGLYNVDLVLFYHFSWGGGGSQVLLR